MSLRVAVHPELAYSRLERGGDSVWLADAARERYAAELAGYEVRETVPGCALVGRRYQPPFDAFPGERRSAFFLVYAGNCCTKSTETTDGRGSAFTS